MLWKLISTLPPGVMPLPETVIEAPGETVELLTPTVGCVTYGAAEADSAKPNRAKDPAKITSTARLNAFTG